MAYVPTYRTQFTNENMNIVVITLSEKDGTAESVTEYACASARLSYNGEEGKVTGIHGMSLECELFVDVDETDPTPVLVQALQDTWKVEVTVDNKPFFSGFLVPDEGGNPFQDLPYNVKFTATDGLGLLKDIEMVGDFNQHNSLIYYLSFCLKQTGLELPIRVKDYIYHASMTDRGTDTAADFVSQAYLEERTFQKDAITYINCYEALELILGNSFRLSQDNGEWKITRLGMLQHVPFVPYETLYDANGENGVGVEVTENYATVGKHELIYPHGEDQIKYIKRAVKSSKLVYNYDVWPELPRNNKFERGAFAGTETALDDTDLDGDDDFTEVIGTRKKYRINNWTWGEFDLTDLPNFTMNTGPVDEPLVNKIYNEYDLEILREVSIPYTPNRGSGKVSGLKCGAVPVVQGDRIKFSLDKRYSQDIDGGLNTYSLAAIIYIIPDGGGDAWTLVNSYTNPSIDGTWSNSQVFFSFVNGIYVRFGDTDARRYTSASIESNPIPVSGNLYIILVNPSPGPNVTAYYRGVELEYLPMVAGGFQKVRGDYELITQTDNYRDKGEREIGISDNIHKVFKGCLLDSAGIPFTPDWRRLGIDEHKSYKKLCNYALFNFEHRRMDMIEGSFSELMYAPANNQEFYYPISLHKQYRFVDIPGKDKRFLLCSPLEMDLVKGWLTARFWEIFDNDESDGTTEGTEGFKYIY